MKFDDLDKFQKEDIIVTLLSSLPSVKEMKAYLWSRKASSEARLRDWVDRISPAALGLLRWIVASNRSCIIQVDKSPGQTEEDALANNVRLGQKVSNMDGWMQFRFAQGSPDKEHRFHQALIAKQATINPKYPTIFAWHGSSLYNWHGIIRTGLDFNEIANGRAFGNGCYHSPHFTTSLDYCNAGRSNTLVSLPVEFCVPVLTEVGIA
jgi:ubiquitin-conjugating enzyme E2 Q